MSYQNIHPSFFNNNNNNNVGLVSRELELPIKHLNGLTQENPIFKQNIDLKNIQLKDKSFTGTVNVSSNFIVSDVNPQKMYEGDSLSKLNTHAKNMFQKTDETLLSFLFFSKENMENMQKLLKKGVYDNVKVMVSDQSYDELIIVMRLIFLEYARQPEPIRKDTITEKRYTILLKNKEEINRLNGIVLSMLLPKLISEITQYTYYLKDISKLSVKTFNPEFTSSKGEVEMRSITQVLGA
jgi:hypothetical protein